MTYSIVARDPATGHLGIAVASRFFAVGAVVPHLHASGAVATQAFVNPMWGVEGAERLKAGESAATVLADFIARDTGHRQRQAHMIDADNRIAAHTGADCVDWAGHCCAEGISVAGNMLAGPAVIEDTLACYLDNPDRPFAERLLLAMRAGEAAGGDKRGRQSAALRIHHGQDYPWLDIRSDDHPDPLSELERLLEVASERYLIFSRAFGTRDNFSGTTDRTEIDRAIAARERELQAR
ncbi:DUF1028 domain-containing protein [Pseudodonghicola flavimaris]|uniref:DUF1028 domain-containing protein n=1 Tax=Pseudodonghicola flavimaris TaxID=3050036 RepID=A0ABT7F0S1_9RHOB|nr:DUF1028 domain-containing protein [Pseudodonghicola flavimaris]MDK3018190.1 DUF1028 domain-containing protein [Pseudodonghicola flavimaris]